MSLKYAILKSCKIYVRSNLFKQFPKASCVPHQFVHSSAVARQQLQHCVGACGCIDAGIFSAPAVSVSRQLWQASAHRNTGVRWYSTPQRSSSFIGRILDNLKDEAARNSEMKKSLEDFKKDMEELSKSETVIKARDKFYKIEEERAEGTRKARQQLEKLRQKVSQTVEDAQNIEMVQKASRITEDARERVQQMGQKISQKGEELAKTRGAQTVRKVTQEVGEELQSSALSGTRTHVYRAPPVLRMRMEVNQDAEQRIMEANTEATGMVLHRDSRFSQSWQHFRDNNPYVGRVLEWKTRLDESDHFLVKASVLVKDKVAELFGPVFHTTDLSQTLTEICKLDPSFTKDTFLLELEYDIIPNILEAMIRPDLKILQDWTYERAYSVIAAEVKQSQVLGHRKVVEVLEVDNVDLAMGKVLDEGPVLAITFQAQIIECTYNMANEVIDGDKDTVLRRHYVWVFCRDQTELNPRAAWKLLEFTYHSATQLV